MSRLASAAVVYCCFLSTAWADPGELHIGANVAATVQDASVGTRLQGTALLGVHDFVALEASAGVERWAGHTAALAGVAGSLVLDTFAWVPEVRAGVGLKASVEGVSPRVTMGIGLKYIPGFSWGATCALGGEWNRDGWISTLVVGGFFMPDG